MKQFGLWTFVVIWFLHLAIGCGSGICIFILWQHRHHPLMRKIAIYMVAAPIGSLMSIVLVFMGRGVTMTWKFSITLFLGTIIADIHRLPFIIYVLQGAKGEGVTLPPQKMDSHNTTDTDLQSTEA